MEYSIRIASLYATKWKFTGPPPEGVPALREVLDLGQLEEYYAILAGQLPTVLDLRQVNSISSIDSAVRLKGMDSWLLRLPSDQVVAALVVEFTDEADPFGGTSAITTVLEAFGFNDLEVEGTPLAAYFNDLARRVGARMAEGTPADALPPERHQVIIAPAFPGRRATEPLSADDEAAAHHFLFRTSAPYREEFLQILKPGGLNQQKTTMGLVTPYVSFLYGHELFVGNSVFLSAVQAVGTAARFRQIWHDAYGHVSSFRREQLEESTGTQTRESLENLADSLGNLELDLSFSVETVADFGLLIPSLRIGTYHHDLFQVMELPDRASTVSKMFTRLDSFIQSELTAIDIREDRRTNRTWRWFAVIGGGLSALGVLASAILAFFGINATQVDGSSMFSPRYDAVWVGAIFSSLVVGFFIYLAARLTRPGPPRAKRRRPAEERPAAAGSDLPHQRQPSDDGRMTLTTGPGKP